MEKKKRKKKESSYLLLMFFGVWLGFFPQFKPLINLNMITLNIRKIL